MELSVVTGGVANTLEICTLASYSKSPGIGGGGGTSSKFRVDIRLITCVSLPIHFRVGTASSLENFFPRTVRDLRLSEWDSQWFRLNDPSSRRSISSRANCRWISSGEEHSSDVLYIFLIITVAHENTLTLLGTFYEYKKFRSIDRSDEVETILRKKNQSNFKNLFSICNLLISYQLEGDNQQEIILRAEKIKNVRNVLSAPANNTVGNFIKNFLSRCSNTFASYCT